MARKPLQQGDTTMSMTIAQIEHVAITAAKAAVHETFTVLGIDIADPLSMQRDMAHLRTWRKIFDGIVGKVIAAGMIGCLLVGVLFLAKSFH